MFFLMQHFYLGLQIIGAISNVRRTLNKMNFDFAPYLGHKTMPIDSFETEILVGEGTN